MLKFNDGDFMAHLYQMEREQNEKDRKTASSLFELLKEANKLLALSRDFSPLKLMDIVEELEESFTNIALDNFGKMGAIINIIISNQIQTSHEENYTEGTHKKLSLAFDAVNHLLNSPPKQTHLDFLFTSQVKALSPSIIFEHIQQNIDHENFSDNFFKFLKEQTPTQFKHAKKHRSRDAMMEERDATPTFSLDELDDTSPFETTGSCTPVNDETEMLSEKQKATDTNNIVVKSTSTIFVDKIINSGISFFEKSSQKANKLAPVFQ